MMRSDTYSGKMLEDWKDKERELFAEDSDN